MIWKNRGATYYVSERAMEMNSNTIIKTNLIEKRIGCLITYNLGNTFSARLKPQKQKLSRLFGLPFDWWVQEISQNDIRMYIILFPHNQFVVETQSGLNSNLTFGSLIAFQETREGTTLERHSQCVGVVGVAWNSFTSTETGLTLVCLFYFFLSLLLFPADCGKTRLAVT